jgi:hypothetical protein
METIIRTQGAHPWLEDRMPWGAKAPVAEERGFAIKL